MAKGGTNQRYGIEDLQYEARIRGGELISGDYTGFETKHKFTCSRGHVFEQSLRLNSWCEFCKKENRIAGIGKHLATHELTLVSKVPEKSSDPITVRCKHNHNPFTKTVYLLELYYCCPTCQSVRRINKKP